MLVIGITSRALFDLDLSHEIFTKEGLESYRSFQISNENIPLKPGRAFPLVKKLLSLNKKNYIELASKKGRIFGTDQVALIMMIHEDGFKAEYLPAYVNWLCEFNLPYYDKINNKFIEPYLPHHPIGLIHLAGLDDLRTNKEILYKINALDGKTIEMSLRFSK